MMANKILIVDDDSNMTKLLNTVFKSDFEITTVHTVTEAHNELKTHSFDAVLVDLNLAGENGHDVLSFIRSEDKLAWLPVIVLSGKEKSEDRIKSFEMGADDYVIKPFNPIELRLRLKRHIEKYQELKTDNR